MPAGGLPDEGRRHAGRQRHCLGAQNVCEPGKASGAFTGEVSAAACCAMRLPLCHRRSLGATQSLYGETDQLVARALRWRWNAGLTPILCVGETLDERERWRDRSRWLRRQVDAVVEACRYRRHRSGGDRLRTGLGHRHRQGGDTGAGAGGARFHSRSAGAMWMPRWPTRCRFCTAAA